MKLKIGIIGTGWFSGKHADIISAMEEAEVTAICGSSKEKAEKMAVDYNGAAGYGDISDMISAEKLDAAYICVPPMSHGRIEEELIQAGIPFLVEKPLANDFALPKNIAAKVKAASLITSVGYHFRYSPATEKLKEILSEQKIGLITGAWMGDMPETAWWRKEEKSGGQLMEQTTHIVDLLRYIAGEAEEVYAVTGHKVNHLSYEGVTAADVGTVSIKMTNGAVVSLSNTCILPQGVGEIGFTVYSDRGITSWSPEELVVQDKQGKQSIEIMEENPYKKESEAFLHALKTGDTSRILSNYEDALQTQKITYAAAVSAKEGRPVKLADI
ncbi:Gfo/Idh/MocA family protein [Alkalicoccus daliensis]|uniref:Predicted dehydrogenase n=1 Tax=Alkalicoccus daliensis TaxID=745820 RepID=A0A1H0FUB8_9BACI|nr:Gfo/Idh/MocA family oxidoreductase [Alkalicoccus daliensis]SDN98240.1 Predicted dehydrogenase [Alkalicoccus daliensis]